jgi:transposase
MNYLQLVNGFWQCDLEHHFTPNDTRLYFFLLHTCNSLGWKIPFGHSDRHLALKLGVSVNTIREAKARLKQRGLIDFKVPDVKSKSYEGQTKFWIKELTVLKFDTVIPPTVSEIDTDTDTVPDTDGDTVPDTNNKLNKTKLKYRDNVKLTKPEYDRLVCELGHEFVEGMLDYYRDYKKEKRPKTSDDNLTIRRWVIDAWREKLQKAQPSTPVISMNDKFKKAANWQPTEEDQW